MKVPKKIPEVKVTKVIPDVKVTEEKGKGKKINENARLEGN